MISHMNSNQISHLSDMSHDMKIVLKYLCKISVDHNYVKDLNISSCGCGKICMMTNTMSFHVTAEENIRQPQGGSATLKIFLKSV